MKRTRVLHVLTSLSLAGAQRSTLHTCRLLPKDRYEVEVATGPETGREGDIRSRFTDAGIPVHVVPEIRRDAGTAGALLAVWRLSALIRKGRFDVVHTHMAMGGVVRSEEPATGEASTPDAFEHDRQAARLRRALLLLREDQRELIVLARYRGMKYEAIADLLGVEVGTVKTRMHRAIVHLREVFLGLSENDPCSVKQPEKRLLMV